MSHFGRIKSFIASPNFWQQSINVCATYFLKDLQPLHIIDVICSICVFRMSQYPSPETGITVKLFAASPGPFY